MDNKNQGRSKLIGITQEMIFPGVVKQRHLVASPTQKGDTYYGGGNSFVNLPIGTSYQLLAVVEGVPAWITFPQTGTSRPTSGRFTGDQYFDTASFILSIWTGSVWKASAAFT